MISLLNIGGAIATFTLLQHLWLNTFSRSVQTHRALMLTCGFVAMYMLSTAQLLGADGIDAARIALRWQTIGVLGYLAGVFWLATSLANFHALRWAHRLTVTFAVLMALLAAYSLALPYGVMLDAVDIHGTSTLLGEAVIELDHHPSDLAPVILALSLLCVGWLIGCSYRIANNGHRFIAALLFSYALVLSAPIIGNLLFYFGLVTVKIPSGISPFYLFAVIALLFGNEHRQLVKELHDNAERLQKEVERRKLAEAKALLQASTDEFTGMPNQIRMREKLQELIDAGRTDTLLVLIHIDQLRKFKQTFGEKNTDRLLLEFSKRIYTLAEQQPLGARISESNFAILAVKPEKLSIDPQGNSVQWDGPHTLKRPFLIGYQSFEIGVSVGVTHVLAEDTVQTAMQRADLALEAAQNSSEKYGFVYFNQQLADMHTRERQLEHDLRDAIPKQQLSLHYQPQVDDHGRLTGAEALLRWQHPEHGWIPPSDFIPLAERSGLMTRIGLWAIEAACRQLKQWRSEGVALPGRLSINVSPWQLQLDNFADMVLHTLNQIDTPAEWLSLELTESALFDNFDRSTLQLQTLREAGLQVALDDFGTGFSSLSYLGELPLDTLKIDKSFVEKIDSGRGKAVLRGMIEIGRALQLDVVIEGVETESQFQALKSLDAKCFQGYLFAKPMAPEDFGRWMADTHASVPLW